MQPDKPTPKRVYVTAEDQQKKTAEIEAMTWVDQSEAIRKENARLLAIVIGAAHLPDDLDARLNALAKLSNIAKQWTVEDRQRPVDLSKLSDEELARLK